MLGDLRRALYEAISESAEVHRSWRRLREEGYSLHLVVDCKKRGAEDDQGVRAQSRGEEPLFEINSQDLAFLRSIGIDPTRRGPRRT